MRENLKDEQLDQVTGGYVVSANGKYYVVADNTGNVLTTGPVESMAKMAAKYQGQSPEVITASDYEKIFGREFKG